MSTASHIVSHTPRFQTSAARAPWSEVQRWGPRNGTVQDVQFCQSWLPKKHCNIFKDRSGAIPPHFGPAKKQPFPLVHLHPPRLLSSVVGSSAGDLFNSWRLLSLVTTCFNCLMFVGQIPAFSDDWVSCAVFFRFQVSLSLRFPLSLYVDYV